MATITVETQKLDITNEKKEIVRSMYHLKLKAGKITHEMSIGKTTYETIKKMQDAKE